MVGLRIFQRLSQISIELSFWIIVELPVHFNQVILSSHMPSHNTSNVENHLLIKSWFYDETDDCLLHYTNFLLECAKKWRTNMLKIKDLRRCLKEFTPTN